MFVDQAGDRAKDSIASRITIARKTTSQKVIDDNSFFISTPRVPNFRQSQRKQLTRFIE